jgi:hypothetical protein
VVNVETPIWDKCGRIANKLYMKAIQEIKNEKS